MDILGCPYPIVKNPKGFLRTQTGVDQVKSDLLVLLLTNPGERVFLPTFGTPLRTLIFEPNDQSTADQARQMIINSINLWEPRITVTGLEVVTSIDSNDLNSNDNGNEVPYILGIKIEFTDPENIKNIQTLVLEVPLPGGS